MRLIDVNGAKDALPGKKVFKPDNGFISLTDREFGFNSYRDHVEKVEVGFDDKALLMLIHDFKRHCDFEIANYEFEYLVTHLSQNSHKFLTLKKGE